jgi:hypothetical protein
MVNCAMAVYDPHEVLHRCQDGSWSVCAHQRRLIFLNGGSAVEVPVEAPLRWCQDGENVTFERALEMVPEELHGWMTLAAIIGLRHCLGGIITAVALPAGYHDWPCMAGRAEPVCAWMHVLAGLDRIDPPPVPDGIDDGLTGQLDGDGDAAQVAER